MVQSTSVTDVNYRVTRPRPGEPKARPRRGVDQSLRPAKAGLLCIARCSASGCLASGGIPLGPGAFWRLETALLVVFRDDAGCLLGVIQWRNHFGDDRKGLLVKSIGMATLSVILPVLVGCSGGSGSSWYEEAAFEDMYSLNDLWVFGPDDVWVVGGTIQRFDGTDWTQQTADSHAQFMSIWGFSPDDLWIAGGDSLAHWDGSNLTTTDLGAQGMQDATAIWGMPPDRLWIVGDSASVLQWDGESWTRTSIPCSSNSSIFGFSENDIWTQGTFGTCHFNGSTWEEVDTGIWGGDGQVFGFSGDDVWLVAESSEAAHFDGESWTTYENHNFVGELAALWGATSDDIWGVGSAGSIAHFDGQGWHEVTHQTIGSPFLRMFTAVHGSSAQEVWAVGTEMGAERNCALVFRHRAD